MDGFLCFSIVTPGILLVFILLSSIGPIKKELGRIKKSKNKFVELVPWVTLVSVLVLLMCFFAYEIFLKQP